VRLTEHPSTPRILLLEDDASLGRTLADRLEREHFAPVWARSVAAARQEFANGPWDLAILDVRLPDGCGFSLARELRRASSVPIMFMTALDSAESRLEGSEIEASTYLPKPFHIRELLIRIRLAIQPRRAAAVVRVDDIEIDLAAMTVTQTDGQRIFLQARDARVLSLLMDAAPRAVSRSEILDAAWGEDRFPTARGVDNAIVRLRQALGDSGAALIQSVRGIGYQWMVRP
jgi:DNA-binding response OmpR family regulator